MSTQQPILQIKTIAVGDSGVGKSSILTRFAHDKFNEFTQPTMGAAFITKRYAMPDDRRTIEFHVCVIIISTQIWDTAGQEKYKSIAPIYYREAKIALCVYDITSMRSFDIMKRWVEQLKENGPKDIVLAVVGNKIDRYDEEQVQYQLAKEYASEIGALFKLVSAKQGKNVTDLFTAVAEQVLKKQSQGQPKKQNQSLKKKKEKKKGCC